MQLSKKQKIYSLVLSSIGLLGILSALYMQQDRREEMLVKNSLALVSVNAITAHFSGSETTAKAQVVAQVSPDPIPTSVENNNFANGILILMYHHIGSVPQLAIQNHDTVREGLTVSVQDFTTQVAWLKAHGYTSITPYDVYNYSRGNFTLPNKPVVFTFDDGYDDAVINAPPILKQYGYTGTFGIITNDPGQTQGTNVYASWQQILGAKNLGMNIVCHTEDHFDGANPKYNAEFIGNELSGCQQALAAHLGSTEPFMIYPYGHYTQTYIGQEQKSGIVMAFEEGGRYYQRTDEIFAVPRIGVRGGESLDVFKKSLGY